ncbi:hypothetical protein [Aquimarina litoralis]|uniref:hypothetical protein n=1 Tax=Aquimarina litoralis TaxID=584605 RepID=UPI001C598A02|nr:hypothetical protein [Aquimarina litoralis]MBW1294493.1 hypothetical protein [Aquimarina litoralis]
MSKIKFLMVAVLICFSLFINAQEGNNTNDSSIWYSYTTEGEMISCELLEDKIVYRSPFNSDDAKNVSTLWIRKKLDKDHFVVYNKLRKPQYAILHIAQSNANVLKITTVLKGDSIESLEKDFQGNKLPAWIGLFEKDWYSEKYIKQLKNSPGLDELKRADLLTAMQWRKPLSSQIQEYLKDTQGKRQFMIYRFVNEFRNRKLVELGYNPYKRVSYNFKKQFEGDEEILNLLFEEIKF